MTSGFLMQSLQLAGIGAMLLCLNAKLALVTLLPMPLILAGSWYFTRYLQPRHQYYWAAVGKQASSLLGMLTGIRVVKAFVQEDREIRRFGDSSRRLRDSRLTVDIASVNFTAAMGLLFGLGALVVWYIGGRDVLFGSMTLGSLMASPWWRCFTRR
jgi:ATP-binding cassette subfamily B protein